MQAQRLTAPAARNRPLTGGKQGKTSPHDGRVGGEKLPDEKLCLSLGLKEIKDKTCPGSPRVAQKGSVTCPRLFYLT